MTIRYHTTTTTPSTNTTTTDPHTTLPPHTPLPASQTFPTPTSTTPYWRKDLHPLDSHRSTPSLPSTTDIAIIGAGMSGVATAYHILQSQSHQSSTTPPPSVTILEARQLCSGATGRNGGHLKLSLIGLSTVLKRHGVEAANELAEFYMRQIRAMNEVVGREELDCEWLLTRSFDVFMDEAQAREQEEEVRTLREHVKVVRDEVGVIRREDVEAVTGVKGAAGARSVPAASLWPYKFVCGLMSQIIDRVDLQTHTMVHSVSAERDTEGFYTICTARGTLKAGKVVFASNAYTAGILPSLEGVITPTKGTNSRVDRRHKTRVDALQKRTYTYNISKDRDHVDYINHRPDGGTIIGGAYQTFEKDIKTWIATIDDSTQIHEPQPSRYFEDRMETYYQNWADSGAMVSKIWTGIMGRTPDGFPFVGEFPDREGQYIAAGFNGAGMLFIFLSSQGLARMITKGIPFEQTRLPKIFQSTKERLQT